MFRRGNTGAGRTSPVTWPLLRNTQESSEFCGNERMAGTADFSVAVLYLIKYILYLSFQKTNLS